MHRIYTTEGYILGGKNRGEANRYYYILTRDLGLIIASAQGVRTAHSKLKASLQDFSYSSLSLVHGKGGWKITNASIIHSVFVSFKKHEKALVLCANIFNFVRRLVTGEISDERLFAIIHSGIEHSRGREVMSDLDIRAFESLLMLRILHILGYVDDHKEIAQFLSTEWTEEVFKSVGKVEQLVRLKINQSLQASNL